MTSSSMPSVRVEHDVEIAMRDGTLLRADIMRPTAARRSPVLLLRTPYGKGRQAGRNSPLDLKRAVAAGYAIVIQDCRGRYTSGGEFYPFRDEGSDGETTIAWCTEQRWADGRVATFGNSYSAMAHWLAALRQPPGLVAMLSGLCPSGVYRGWAYRGGAFNLAFNVWWASQRLILDQAGSRAPFDEDGDTSIIRRMRAKLLERLAKWPLPIADQSALARTGPYLAEWIAHPTFDPYWAPWDLVGQYGRAEVPVLHYTGWYDAFMPGTLENYSGVRTEASSATARAGQSLIVGPWAHSSVLGRVVGERDFGVNADAKAMDFHGSLISWLDHHMAAGGQPGVKSPAARIFVMQRNAWQDLADWPPRGLRPVTYHLSSNGHANAAGGDGVLAEELHPSQVPDAFTDDPLRPVPTTGGNIICDPAVVRAGPCDQAAIEARSDVLVYTSAPLPADTEAVGPVEVSLVASSSTYSSDFIAKLVDVSPDGRTTNVCDGIVRTAAATPDNPYRHRIDMGNTAYVFRKKHRLRLQVSSSDFPRFDRNPETLKFGADGRTVMHRVFHGHDADSYLTLHVS